MEGTCRGIVVMCGDNTVMGRWALITFDVLILELTVQSTSEVLILE